MLQAKILMSSRDSYKYLIRFTAPQNFRNTLYFQLLLYQLLYPRLKQPIVSCLPGQKTNYAAIILIVWDSTRFSEV